MDIYGEMPQSLQNCLNDLNECTFSRVLWSFSYLEALSTYLFELLRLLGGPMHCATRKG